MAAPPAAFGATTNLLWSTETLSGHSSPVIFGDRVFLTGLQTGRLHTLAFNRANGKLLWQKPAPAVPIEKVHSFASPATPSVLADEARVITYFGSHGVLCYDHNGKELWSKALPTPKSTYGMASSPIRAGNTVVLVLDSNDKSSKLLALNVADGSTAWETARPLSASGWATPMVWEHNGRSEIVVPGARRLISYDSRTGAELWWMDGFPPEVIGIPVSDDGLLYVSAAGLAGPPNAGFETMSWPDMLPLDSDGDGKIQKSEVPQNFRFTLRPELPHDNSGRYLPVAFRSTLTATATGS
jgi:outer membrane protein assembly factor BamB